MEHLILNKRLPWKGSLESFDGSEYVSELENKNFKCEYGTVEGSGNWDRYIKFSKDDSVGNMAFNDSSATFQLEYPSKDISYKGRSFEDFKKVLPLLNSIEIAFDIDNVQIPLSELAGYMAGFFFDMRDVHFKVRGKEFYTYHKLAEDLYEKAEDFYDDLVETAMIYGEFCDDMQCIPNDWSPLNLRIISIDAAIAHIYDRLKSIFEKIKSVKQGYDSFVYSKLDSMSEYFAKELYKINQAKAPFEE